MTEKVEYWFSVQPESYSSIAAFPMDGLSIRFGSDLLTAR